jgi:cyclopropane fatty-acyl-phospholipid synthase-like methyltransferase
MPGDQEQENSASAVRAYYESNTRLFLSLGIGWQLLAMRRAVWADGVETLALAVDFVNSLIAAEAASLGAIRALDIGCGVGGSLIFLADAVGPDFRGLGVTISPRQAQIAQRQARSRGLSGQLSFVQFTTPTDFFAAAARSLAPGGRLVVVDDFLSGDAFHRRERRMVDAFQRGWLLPSLCSVSHASRAASACGLRVVEDRNLSSRLSRLPLSASLVSRLVLVMRALPVPWPYWRSSVGSLALACCQQARLVEYHYIVFEKQEA